MIELVIVLVGLAQPLAAPPHAARPVVPLTPEAARALHVLRIQMAAVCSARTTVARDFTDDQSPSCRAIADGVDPLALHGLALWWDGPSLLATGQAQLAQERASLRALEQRKASLGAQSAQGPQMRLRAPEAPRSVLQRMLEQESTR